MVTLGHHLELYAMLIFLPQLAFAIHGILLFTLDTRVVRFFTPLCVLLCLLIIGLFMTTYSIGEYLIATAQTTREEALGNLLVLLSFYGFAPGSVLAIFYILSLIL